KASSSRKACWTGCREESAAKPSIVVIFFPAAAPICMRQERTGEPSTKTVQAPHCPSPHPYLAPVRPRSSRRTLRRLASDATSTLCSTPFTNKVKAMSIRPEKLSLVQVHELGRAILVFVFRIGNRRRRVAGRETVGEGPVHILLAFLFLFLFRFVAAGPFPSFGCRSLFPHGLLYLLIRVS